MLTQSKTKPIKQLADKLYEWANIREPKLPDRIRQGSVVHKSIGHLSYYGSLINAVGNLPDLVLTLLHSLMPEQLDSIKKNLNDLYEKAKSVDHERSESGGEANIKKYQSQAAAKSLAKKLRFLDELHREQIENIKKPSETEQDITPAKHRGIRTRFNKVVEKAWKLFTKSFWETFFDRIFGQQ